MSKFKVGDKVMCLDRDFSFYKEVGVVETFDGILYGVYVPSHGDVYNHYEHELELVEQEEEQMEDKQEVKVTGNAFKYGFKVGDVVKWVENGLVYTVEADGLARNEIEEFIMFCDNESSYTLVKPAKETLVEDHFTQSVNFHSESAAVNSYKTTTTTTISLEQGQVESILIKALSLGGKGVKAEWNQDGSIEISYKDKE